MSPRSEKSRRGKAKGQGRNPGATAHAKRRKGAAPPLTPQRVYEALEPLYGPVQWNPSYDPVSELVCTILSQHTSDVNSEKAYRQLLEAFGSWEAVAEADPEDIAQHIWIGGLSHIKAPRIKAVLQRIRELRDGSLELAFLKELSLEEAKAWLRQLPGIGPKSAAVILCFALGMPAFPVDTHIHRVAKRLGLIGPNATAEQAHDLMEAQIPPEWAFPFHVYLITHGRRVCKAPRPHCQECVLNQDCPSSLVRI